MSVLFLLFIYLINRNVESKPTQIHSDLKEVKLFEGDIEGVQIDDSKGVAILVNSYNVPWPNGIVPYKYETGDYNSAEIAQIEAGMRLVEDVTKIGSKYCVKFVPYTNQANWINIRNGDGCSSAVGKSFEPGEQNLSLHKPKDTSDSTCLIPGIVAHELIHTLGFWHEQSRPDRDYYVNIFWDNIATNHEKNFNKYTTTADTLGTPYDYGSIMHYGSKDFSRNGSPTILPKLSIVTIGQRDTPSKIDIEEIRKYYRCS